MRRFRIRALVAALGLLLLLPGALPSRAQAPAAPKRTTLQVFAAASLSDAFTEIGRQLERQRPGLRVQFNFAGSQLLAAQIEQGAAADVFASADERWMSYARQFQLLGGDPTIFARNPLVVIVPRSNPARIQRLQDLARGGVKLVLGADVVPVGRYSRIVLRNLAHEPGFAADYTSLVRRNVVSEEENVKSVVGKVQLGEADAGMVYRSDVTPAVARYLRVFAIPESANVLASYPMAIVAGAKEPEAARAYMDLVLSPQGQQVLERNGFIPLTKASP